MDYPSDYESRIRDLERQLRYVMDVLSGMYLRREANILPQGAGDIYIGITDAELTVDSSGTVSRYEGSTGTEIDTGINDTVKNRMATVPAGRWVHYTQIDGVYYVIAARCTAITTTTTTTTGVPTTTTTLVPTTTLAPSSTTLAPTSTTLAPTTTTVSPSLRYFCTVVAGADCATATGVACQAGDDAGNPPAEIPVCSGPYVSLAECESSCSPPTTTLPPSSTTLAPSSTTAGPTTAAPTTTLAPTSTTTAAPGSTTTSAPLGPCQGCIMEWNGSSWSAVVDMCSGQAGCPGSYCLFPINNGTFVGQREQTSCGTA